MFRVTIRGKFTGLDEAGRAAVLAAGGTAFTEAGTFTHDQSVTAFTFRCEVPAGPDDGEDEAALGAMAVLEAHGHPHEILRLAVTDMREIRIRRKGRASAR
ncbi:DUF6204 family protein [Nonomuraea muscovyensis]|jgi:hypothetical protein|uniref:Uncharacterized protein n=1 Tax=Nonomuraea muscovyensis TaxID=1124761 RepID=A0A7X0C1T9_9ACTN|nr:DUF6204 family protein [Nonomuraea muscovyensis]MBB6346947.1 hypothetical protein [Nonomuraea muscovyensis]MDF2704935.1 hypothetical protein [Nonomuraea muscovyensis]